jgi:hypothetical protein
MKRGQFIEEFEKLSSDSERWYKGKPCITK